MEGIIALIVLIADIYAIVKVFESSADTITKVVWIVIILALPVLGFIAWFFAGPGGSKG